LSRLASSTGEAPMAAERDRTSAHVTWFFAPSTMLAMSSRSCLVRRTTISIASDVCRASA
jgi:hypothetical protein